MKVILLFIFLTCIGCATATKQTDTLLKENTRTPKVQEIENVNFLNQAVGHCGPATLTMAMRWAGKDVSVEQIAPQVFTKGMKGSMQTDMISASRRQGLIAIPIYGLPALIKEVSAGNPVIVFENLAFSWMPQWHYAIVFGYDFENEKIIMHSGPEPYKHWDMRKFERSWMLADYWGLVVLPVDRLSASADELSHVIAASAIEKIGDLDNASKAYHKILERWPLSLSAHIGIANILFASGKFKEAVASLGKTVKNHSNSAAAWHNLAIAQGALHRKKSARASAQRALRLVGANDRIMYLESLKIWLPK